MKGTMFSMNCSHHDIILLPIPFTDLSSHKVRRAIVIGFDSFPGDLFVVPITSQLTDSDFALIDWRSSGLNVESRVKGRLCTIESRVVRKIIGRLSRNDATILEGFLRQWLKL